MLPRLRPMKSSLTYLAVGAVLLAAPAQVRADTYTIDPAHSSVSFTIRHDALFKLTAGFTRFHGSVILDPDRPLGDTAEVAIEVASLDTHIHARDEDLKSPHYFDSAKFPLITFRGRVWRRTGAGTFEVKGDLTIKNVTKEVLLSVKRLDSPGGGHSWEATTTLNRKDFGIQGPSVLDKGISDKLDVAIAVHAVKP